jgi:trehalose 6-phosphate synthase/phosphatase
VTPIRDGMNLVAKEFCASSIDRECMLILSEFAGAAAQLGESALLVNPYDTDGVAEALLRAYSMSPREKNSRMQSLRQSICRDDIFRWMNDFMSAAGKAGLPDSDANDPMQSLTPGPGVLTPPRAMLS